MEERGLLGDTLKYPQSVYTVGKEVKGNAEMLRVTEVGKWDIIQVEQCLFFVHLSLEHALRMGVNLLFYILWPPERKTCWCRNEEPSFFPCVQGDGIPTPESPVGSGLEAGPVA